MESKNKVFDSADVSLHNNDKDCWIIVNAKVYDVTNFLNDHPGGDDVLLAVAGKNASEEFEEAGHGSAARLMLDEYYIGEVDHTTNYSSISGAATSELESYIEQKTITKEDTQTRVSFMMNPVGLLVSLVVFGIAVGFVLYK